MTTTRRIALLIAGVLALVLVGSLAIQTLTARQTLQFQIGLRNDDAASALARTLSRQHRDAAAMRALAAEHFELGRYRSLRLLAADGSTLVDLSQSSPAGRAPSWFAAVLPIGAAPGSATIGDGGAEAGRLQLQSHAGWAIDALWDASLRTALLLALLALAAAALAAWLLRGWRRPLDAAVAQAMALEQGRYVEADEPRPPELRQLVRSLNATMRRLRDSLGTQARQVEQLQRQVQLDDVTGLPLRRHFLVRLQDHLADPTASGAALILVRVRQLAAVNERLGREATDRVLCAVADVLQTYVERVPGTLGGRLNGSDFALVLPVPGVAAETAESIHVTLDAAPALRAAGVEIAIGAADGLHEGDAGTALAEADAALARAEAGAGLAVDGRAELAAEAGGGRAWREQLAAALDGGRFRLGEFPAVAPDGRLIHLECPLRVQLQVDGDYLVAARWLALARRSRLMPQVDLAALDLALVACARDGMPRAVHVALSSLAAPGFAAEVVRRLHHAPDAARRLSLEWPEPARPAESRLAAEAAALWRRHGARVGVEHAGASLVQLTRLGESGIDYVKVDARHLRGVAADAAVRAYAASLLSLVHGLALTALAEGVGDAQDLAALWALGFDGATGPAVSMPGPSAA